MNLVAPIDFQRYAAKVWWVMLAGCAARFAADSSDGYALAWFAFWLFFFGMSWLLRVALARGKNAKSNLEKAGNAIAAIGIAVFAIRFSAGDVMPALLSLLLATQAAMFIVAHKRIHVLLILAAAFGNVLFAAAMSRSAWFLPCAAWFTFATLSVLAFDVRMTREAQSAAIPVDAPKARSGSAVFAVCVLAIAVPLYLFIPKPAALMLGGMSAQTAHDYRDDIDTSAEEARDGSSQSEQAENSASDSDIGSPESLEDSTGTASEPSDSPKDTGDSFDVNDVQRDRSLANNIVMYVKSSQPVNLRGKIYDRFASNRWHRSTHDMQRHELISGNWERSDSRGSTAILQTVEVVRHLDSTLVHAPGLSRLRFPAPSIREYDDGVFELPRPILGETTYSVESRIDVFDGRYVDVAPRRRLMTEYLLLPDDITPRVRELAKNITARDGSPFEKAVALESHLRSRYEYSFETIQYQGFTPIDWFLFEGKRGHCEYFASALAVMLRSVGIPSRLATGYSLGERNPLTGYYEVRALNGHAWVEAYIPDRGWMMLEPTPFYPLPTPESRNQIAAELDRYLDMLAEQNRAIDPNSVRTQVIAQLRDTWATLRHVSKWAVEGIVALGWWMPIAGASVLLLSALFYLAWLWIVDERDNREAFSLLRAKTDLNRDKTLSVQHALELIAAPRGFGRRVNTTVQQYIARLHARDPKTPLEFADAFDEARYAEGGPVYDQSAIAMEATVTAAIAMEPHPRFRAALRRWSQRLTDWIPAR